MISQNLDSELLFSNTIENFLKNYKVNELIHKYFPAKRSGIQPEEIINYLLHLRFSSQTIYSNRNSDHLEVPCDENTIYRFLNSPDNIWEGFLSELSLRVIDDRKNSELNGIFIVDDTDRPRYDGKKVELNSYQYDHTGLCKRRKYRGFKELTLGYMADGSYLPIDLVLSSGKESLNETFIHPAEGTPGQRRRELSNLGKNKALFEMIQSAQDKGYKAGYLLADSWYTEPKTAFEALDYGLEYIGMVKQEGRTRYLFQGEMLTVHEIFNYYKKIWDEYGYEGPVFLDVPVKMFSQGREGNARLLFFDNVHEEKPYCCFLVTDLALPALSLQQIYKARFGCEHCYKSLKDPDTVRTLKNCQSLSFDANLAQSCLDLMVYNILVDLDRQSEEKKPPKTGFRQARESISSAKWLNLINELLKAVLKLLSRELQESLDYLMLTVKHFLTDYDPLVREINKLSRFENLDPVNLIEKLLIKESL